MSGAPIITTSAIQQRLVAPAAVRVYRQNQQVMFRMMDDMNNQGQLARNAAPAARGIRPGGFGGGQI